jgi:helix-turn-helix protein
VIDLAKLVDDASLADLAEVAAALERARVKLALRLAAPAQPAPAAGRWLTPEEAATIARASKRQVYEWAIGKGWAHRPSRRKLLIDEAGFLAWLSSRP